MPLPKDPIKLQEYKEKMSQIAKARGYGKWMMGKKLSPEAIAKMREAQVAIGNDPQERASRSLRAKQNGYGKWMKGRNTSHYKRQSRSGLTYEDIYGERAKEEKAKRKNSNKARFTGKSSRAQRPHKHNANSQYTDWRRAVFERDKYICQVCKQSSCYLEAHHLKSWANYPALRFDVANGLTLCKPCHKEANKKQRVQEQKFTAKAE